MDNEGYNLKLMLIGMYIESIKPKTRHITVMKVGNTTIRRIVLSDGKIIETYIKDKQ